MKPSEAAEILEGIEEFRGNLPEDGLLVEEAVSMAISALKKQSVDKCCETCKHKRHTAIEWPCRECYMSLCEKKDMPAL